MKDVKNHKVFPNLLQTQQKQILCIIYVLIALLAYNVIFLFFNQCSELLSSLESLCQFHTYRSYMWCLSTPIKFSFITVRSRCWDLTFSSHMDFYQSLADAVKEYSTQGQQPSPNFIDQLKLQGFYVMLGQWIEERTIWTNHTLASST